MSIAIDHGSVRQFRSGNRLSLEDIAYIEGELRNWSKPKITWNTVVSRVGMVIGRRFSRQALEHNPAIYGAYVDAKERLRKGLAPSKRKPLAERIAVLQAENKRLREENDALLEKFVTWLFNAESYGLRTDELNAPLPTARLPSDTRDQELKRKEKERSALIEPTPKRRIPRKKR